MVLGCLCQVFSTFSQQYRFGTLAFSAVLPGQLCWWHFGASISDPSQNEGKENKKLSGKSMLGLGKGCFHWKSTSEHPSLCMPISCTQLHAFAAMSAQQALPAPWGGGKGIYT